MKEGGGEVPKLFPAAIVVCRSLFSLCFFLSASLLFLCQFAVVHTYYFIRKKIFYLQSQFLALISLSIKVLFPLALCILLRALVSVPFFWLPLQSEVWLKHSIKVPALPLPLCLWGAAFAARGKVRSGHDDCLAKCFCPCTWWSFYYWNP